MSSTTCAVVVTRNRRELLRECLTALMGQSVPADEILVVDNASTDGTGELLRSQFAQAHVLSLERNEGGAGGFSRGMSWAYARGHAWLWLMDDDTIPAPDAHEALLAGVARVPRAEPPVLMASKVLWTDGSLHPMNRPGPRWRWLSELVVGCGRGLLLVRYATFVSVLVHRRAVAEHGLPHADYFIWSDDLEYTGRILRHQPGYLVPESVVHHRTRSAYTAVEGSGERFYYHVRNTLLMLRGRSWDAVERTRYLWILLGTMVAYTRVNRRSGRALAVVARGVRDGLRGPVR